MNTIAGRTTTGLWIALAFAANTAAAEKLAVLLIDGQNNHQWTVTTPIIESVLEESGRFTVDVSTTPAGPPRLPRRPKTDDPQTLAEWAAEVQKLKHEAEQAAPAIAQQWDAWRPNFAGYDVVVSNYNGEEWPPAVKEAFVDYVETGGGFVAVHAANNSFPGWPEYNRMIALGGWGGRTEKDGPYVRWVDGQFVRDAAPGTGGAHGQRTPFTIVVRNADHPITHGLPAEFMQTADELYGLLRGPAANLTPLATAWSDPATGGSGNHEPILMVVDFGKGRVFHTTLGHDATAMSGLAFQETLRRGTEWAATGKVTFPSLDRDALPADRAGIRVVGQ